MKFKPLGERVPSDGGLPTPPHPENENIGKPQRIKSQTRSRSGLDLRAASHQHRPEMAGKCRLEQVSHRTCDTVR